MAIHPTHPPTVEYFEQFCEIWKVPTVLIFVELGWGVDEGSTWCLNEVGVGLGCYTYVKVTPILQR